MGGLGLKSLGVDTYLLFVLSFSLIFDDAVNCGKKGVILAYPYIVTRMNSRSLLANQDIARLDRLPAEPFHAQSLSSAISAVSRTPSCFFVCHRFTSKS